MGAMGRRLKAICGLGTLLYVRASLALPKLRYDDITQPSEIIDTWVSFLNDPPQESVTIAQQLSDRADQVVESMLANVSNNDGRLVISGDIDVVCSGGGFFDAYYLGIAMVLDRAQQKSMGFDMIRYGGVSAGGMLPFEVALKGEMTTLVTHLSYGVLSEQYPKWFESDVMAVELSDKCWRALASWQTQKYAQSIGPSLNGTVFVGTSCFEPTLTLVIVSNYTAMNDQATHAFMATGTIKEEYDGMLCSDGGSTSGPDMTPLFQDGLRPQLIVNLMETGQPSEMVMKVNITTYAELIEQGQDEAALFLQTGTCRANAISLCPTTAKVDQNICEI